MTVLSAMQSAAVRLIGRKPQAFFSAQQNPFELEMVNLLNEVARDIALSHDWQALTKVETIHGDGATASFALPDDYDRMVLAQSMSDANNWFWHYTRCPDMDTWIAIQNGFYLGAIPPGWWMLLGNEFHFAPVPPDGARAQYPYISRNYARSVNGQEKPAFTDDQDTFVLDERLLTLGLIWRWREMKNLTVGGEEVQFRKAFDEQAARDNGARALRSRRRRWYGARVAWPWALGE